ncbi:hypothetical protein B7982_09550 [Fibrobacter sp. UWB2]|uniref:FISUMP domain-containing protein n=1 Tax=Fibrobacter sp. UWB2 TaxID=1964358 RepID=UPI000B5246B8|nr:FISUMP domain-containing protein [Fibrobacter sp. UWB2]OWV22458.1 hypothetical protein B7982_09550 [Fibrobacter sp. UWB2]
MHYAKLSVAGCAALMFGLIACSGEDGKDGVNGVNGLNGADGASCEVKSLKDESGYKVLCGGDSVGVLLNGKTGATGKQGIAGATGAKGDTGKTGESCKVEPITDGYKVLCGNKEVGTLKNGAKGESCTTSEAEEGIKITCGTTSTVLKNKSCTVKETADKDGTKGIQMTCDDGTGGTVWNGKSGTSCTAKKDGDELKMYCDDKLVGSVTDGTSCVSTDNGEGVVTVKCGDAEPVVIAKAMCGDKTYDPADQFCVLTTLFDKCGTDAKKVAYNISSEYCEAGVVTPMCIDVEFKDQVEVKVEDISMRAPKADEFCWNGFITKKCGGKEFGDYEFCGTTNDRTKDSIMTYCARYTKIDDIIIDLNKSRIVRDADEEDLDARAELFSFIYGASSPYSRESVNDFFVKLDQYKVKPTQFCDEELEMVFNKCGDKTFSPKNQFCDRRDNHVYSVVKVGSNWWMGENLAFEYKLPLIENDKIKVGGKVMYFEKDAYENYAGEDGFRYYTWASATGAGDVRTTSTLPEAFINAVEGDELESHKLVTGACPEGWRLPTKEELQTLVESRELLKSFNVAASGYYNVEFVVDPETEKEVAKTTLMSADDAFLWSNTDQEADGAKAIALMYPHDSNVLETTFDAYTKTLALPIRCIADVD